MVLSDLLVALANNTKCYITLLDENGDELITFNAVGYASVESDLGAREVKKIQITSGTSVAISLKEEVTP